MMSRDNKRNVGKCMLAAAHDLTSAFSKNPINYSPLDECMINGQMIKGILFSVQNNYVGTIGVARKKKKKHSLAASKIASAKVVVGLSRVLLMLKIGPTTNG
ncbi:hypothetical protein HanRHA438_Chr13g0589111 [Helianthus annuus]|nr:hypothetical protein HanHA89_Chr13g0506041 [Helianthus annuus]KAJ0663002.1 hypothetical protein HanLR1_Chr13g0476191 [Helianthus annuus]KAJ0670498.1 hypothetical protein HanOQP8_Chr13g0474981 [Helianthus annuus]KAJ0857353.1 hypothetical protein HanRHA438_Chr13g0589111 [Helianthus annuus]